MFQIVAASIIAGFTYCVGPVCHKAELEAPNMQACVMYAPGAISKWLNENHPGATLDGGWKCYPYSRLQLPA